MKIHSCIEAHIEDSSAMTVEIQQPCCCCSPVDIHAADNHCDIDIADSKAASFNINDNCESAVLNIESMDATITLEWVCGVGFSERYLCGCDSELITIDGNYLVVKYKPEK